MNPPRDFGFRIVALRLVGFRKNYDISFVDEAGRINPLSIIAGEISTGKTTVLEFVDYCLGASRHPEHPEILTSVRSVQLEIVTYEPVPTEAAASGTSDDSELSEDAARWAIEENHYVIQRSVETSARSALAYRGTLESMNGMPRKLSPDSSAEDSISKFFLQLCGLDGIRLRQAPSQLDSVTHALSFRDLSALWFLSNTRLDNKNLLHEHQPHIAIKLRQVIDILFDVHDQSGAALAAQISELRTELAAERTGMHALRRFLEDQGVAGHGELEAREETILRQHRSAQADLQRLDEQVTENTGFASQLRNEYFEQARVAREAGTRARDRETLHRRLLPLKAQYAEDIKKLTLLVEARRLFDPLTVTVCPACLETLKSTTKVVNGQCGLCRAPLPLQPVEGTVESNGRSDDQEDHSEVVAPDGSSDPEGRDRSQESVDVSKELRSVQRRLRELNGYIDVVEREMKDARRLADDADAVASTLQQQLDAMTREVVSPFIAQRDRIYQSISENERLLAEIGQQRRMLAALDAKAELIEKLVGRISETSKRLRELQDSQRQREAVLSNISERFSSILRDFGYPKLAEAEVNRQLVPHVRGMRYDRVGSAGAMTLLSLAWELSIFELAYEWGGRHPGFLMIDSPQKNLAPEQQGGSEEDFSGNAAGAIVRNVYGHIDSWLSGAGRGAQIIIVDNAPPAQASEDVIVRFTGNPSIAPYGLIDDAIYV
ncbi:hypothetical protein [Nonomuraea sp. NPDC049725]|uniref:hypothetical protein n=1 Tax=Nonomuraea sp. NPDC049725 TaxID=3154508 RepID=UPI00343ABD6C